VVGSAFSEADPAVSIMSLVPLIALTVLVNVAVRLF
jgi:hypothetical protein